MMQKEYSVTAEKLIRPTRASGVLECAILDEQILLSPNGAKAFSLNQTASAVWELCDGNSTLEEIDYALRRHFVDASDNIFSELVTVVEELRDLGMLELRGA